MSTPFNRLNPYPAVLKERVLLTKPGSTKETYHLVLDTKGLEYKVGDSLGIYGENNPRLVQEMLDILNISGETEILHPRTQEKMSLRIFLTKKANISKLTSAFLKVFKTEFSIENHDVLDFLKSVSHLSYSLQDLISAFSPLLPRFYSVASSPKVHPDEVHLTVTISTYLHRNELRYGVVSHFISHLAPQESTIHCYVQKAPHFTLPEDDSVSLIMVGPGTGVAPFRGFMQERVAGKARGQHWLIFGERHQKTDFYYDDYWTALVEEGYLQLDLAFSRDQAEKVYVQHRLYEKGRDIWNWLENGAIFYLCGDADPMAKDVEATLIRIFQEFGEKNLDDAHHYLKQLRTSKRYLMDVY